MLIGTTDLNTTLNLTYVLTDVVETLLLDMRSEMKKQGYDLRHDAKHNFNTAIAAIRRLKQDVDKTQFSTQENFGDDSDCLLAFIKMLIDRCGDDDKEEVAEKYDPYSVNRKEGMSFNPDYKVKSEVKELREFTIKGTRIMAYSKKDAIKRLKYK